MQCGVALRPLELGARLVDVVITDCDLSKLYDVRRGCVFDSGGMVPAVLFRRYIVPVYDSCGMIPAVLFRRSSGTIPAVPFRRYRSGGIVPAVRHIIYLQSYQKDTHLYVRSPYDGEMHTRSVMHDP